MASSGIRLGAWDYLRWKHVMPVEKNGRIIGGKLIVYAGEDDEYVTFLAPEAYFELQKWKEYRILSREKVEPIGKKAGWDSNTKTGDLTQWLNSFRDFIVQLMYTQ